MKLNESSKEKKKKTYYALFAKSEHKMERSRLTVRMFQRRGY